jgi:hypothetical protein
MDDTQVFREKVADTAGGLEALVATAHAGGEHKGSWEDCGRAPCAPIRYYAERLREVLKEER